MHSLKGHLLLASPHLVDPNFARAVVLLIHHNEEGAFGVVLNRLADNTIADLWDQVTESACPIDRHVNVGGPVAGPLMVVHTEKKLAEVEILPGLYFAASRENLEKLLADENPQCRVFLGHSGWGEGQLEHELEEGAWLTTPATVDYVFAEEAGLWKRVMQGIGQSLLTSALNIKHLPSNPELN